MSLQIRTANGCILPRATHEAMAAYVESGMLAAAQDYDIGGMQLPCVVEMAANAFFSKASVAMGGYAMLTSGNANLLMAHGTPLQREVFAKNEFAGRWFGTMCLSRAAGRLVAVRHRHARACPTATASRPIRSARATACAATRCGSPPASTSSPRTSCTWCWPRSRAPTASRCRARAASRCSSCRRSWSDARGALTGERNDVALAGLNHKLGYRGTTNTLLNFGEGRFPRAGPRRGAIGYLVGRPAKACAACST